MTLAESYYKVGNDLKMRAAHMDRMAEELLRVADEMSEQSVRAAREFNEARNPDSEQA